MKYFFLFSLLILSHIAHACTCSFPGPIDDKQYNEYDLIIKGKVVKVIEKQFNRIIYIKVDSHFKGTKKSKTIKIESPSQSGECGIFPKNGEQWLIYAYKKENIYNTNLCTRTKNLNPNAWGFRKNEIDEDLKFLERKL